MHITKYVSMDMWGHGQPHLAEGHIERGDVGESRQHAEAAVRDALPALVQVQCREGREARQSREPPVRHLHAVLVYVVAQVEGGQGMQRLQASKAAVSDFPAVGEAEKAQADKAG